MIKFPREKALLFNKINRAIECEDYDVVFKHKNELMECFSEFEKTDIYIGLIKALFYKEHYQDVVIITDELLRRDYERYEIYFYLVFSCIALNDIFTPNMILKKYKILNILEVKNLWNDEGTYSSALNLENDLKKAVIAARFIIELIKEYNYGVSGEDGYLGLRVFELINSLLEIGYDKYLINELTDIANLIFVAYNI